MADETAEAKKASEAKELEAAKAKSGAKAKMIRIRLRSAAPDLAYAQGKIYEVEEKELARLKKYRILDPRIEDAKKREAAGIPLNIEMVDEK